MNFLARIGLIFLSLAFLGACKEENRQDLLIKKWKMAFEKEKIAKAMLPAELQILNILPASQQAKAWAEIQQKIEENTFEFKKDNTFELIMKSESIREKGTWELKGNTLILSKPQIAGKKELIKEDILISKINSKELVLEYRDNKGKSRNILWQSP
jgi:hypothetical protein